MLTKLQIAFGVIAGLALVLFGAGMFASSNVLHVPAWLGPLAWGTLGLVIVSCIGVLVTLVLDRDRPPGSDKKDKDVEASEITPELEASADDDLMPTGAPDLAEIGQTEFDASEAVPMEFTEPGSEETIEFSTLPPEE
jgi:hypothetical protein